MAETCSGLIFSDISKSGPSVAQIVIAHPRMVASDPCRPASTETGDSGEIQGERAACRFP